MSLTKLQSSFNTILSPTMYTLLCNPVLRRKAGGSAIISMAGKGILRLYNSKDPFTVTYNVGYSPEDNISDDDLNTEAVYGIPANTTTPTDALILDYQTVSERYLHVRFGVDYFVASNYLLISNNGTTWTQILSSSEGTTSYFFKATFRFVKIQVTNRHTSIAYNSRISEICAITVNNKIFEKILDYNEKVLNYEFDLSSYWIWVEPNPGITLSVLERSTVTSGSQIWIT